MSDFPDPQVAVALTIPGAVLLAVVLWAIIYGLATWQVASWIGDWLKGRRT